MGSRSSPPPADRRHRPQDGDCVLALAHRGEDYRHSIELVTKKKLRKVELLAGAPRKRGGGRGRGPNRDEQRVIDRKRAQQAEDDYGRLVAERGKGGTSIERMKGGVRVEPLT